MLSESMCTKEYKDKKSNAPCVFCVSSPLWPQPAVPFFRQCLANKMTPRFIEVNTLCSPNPGHKGPCTAALRGILYQGSKGV